MPGPARTRIIVAALATLALAGAGVFAGTAFAGDRAAALPADEPAQGRPAGGQGVRRLTVR